MLSEPSIPISINDWREELARERKKSDELSSLLKNQERNYQKLVSEVKTQLQAEQQKSQSLELSIRKMPEVMNQVSDLQLQLKQSELKCKQMHEEHLRTVHDMELILKESKDNSLAKEFEDYKAYSSKEITEKEKIIIEQNLYIEKTENNLKNLVQEIDYYQGLILSEKQKYLNEVEQLKEDIETLEEELDEERKNKNSNSYKVSTRHFDEMNKHQIADDQNKELRLIIEKIQEELELRNEDLKNSEKKIEHLKQSRLELAEKITQLENKVESLEIQKEEIKKGLANKEEAILFLEEEIKLNVEDHFERLKSDLSSSNTRCKKLEKQIRDMEQSYEDQLEEKLGMIAAGQIQINDLVRKISNFEKDKEIFSEKFMESQKAIMSLENELEERDQKHSRELDNYKEKLNDKFLRLKQERDELKIKLNEIQDQNIFGRPSVIEPGGSLFDELAQLPEGRYSRLSFKPTAVEDTKRIENLISQIAEKDTALRSLTTEKSNIETKHKETYAELKKVNDELKITIRALSHKTQELELAENELEELRSSEDSRLDKGKILVLISEKELLSAEISRLETELMLSKENWAELNNSLYRDLLESQTAVAQAKSEVIRIREENELLKNSRLDPKNIKKKRNIGSWFRREE